jgi:acyl-CoA reductase-like NAD-dependent aldehyde dehydrogenase
MNAYKLLIGGELVDGASEYEVINPATGQPLALCPRADEAQLNAAVAAAKKAFPAWAALSQNERSSKVNAVADTLEADLDSFARLLAQEGKPLFLARWEVSLSIGMLRTMAGMDLSVETLRDNAEGRILQQRTPLGVVAVITPWNFPLFLLIVKLAPGLVAGNAMVVKPAPTTPLTTLKLGEICARLLPPGVVNIITDQNDLGGLLTSNPDIAKIAFTGSTATGRKIMASAASTLKRLTLEMGGNDPAVVLDDMDPKEAATALFNGAMIDSGQTCLAIKRAYVHESIYDAVCVELARLAEAAIVDDGLAPGVQFGPLQNKQQYDKVNELIEDSRTVGKIIAGGRKNSRPGYFIHPTIVRDVPDHARIVQEEQFGPVLPVLSYKDIDEVLTRVNDSEYGLSASVWGKDVARATDVAMRIEAGTVWINKHLDLPFDIPYRGAKQSGIGVEFGYEGLKEYTQAKVINIAPERTQV